MTRILPFAVIAILAAARVEAQQRPLVTEDPETVGSGLVLIEAGFDVQREIFYPVSGLTGNLLRLPTLGVSFGISPIAELQIDGGIYNRLTVTDRRGAPLSSLLQFTGEHSTDVEPIVIGTKIRLLSEAAGRPALGLRVATKLPTASNESGIGLDTTDFFASFLIGKTIQSIRVVGNAGLGILSDPVEGYRQNDVFTYGLSLARAVAAGVEVVGDVNGHVSMRDSDTPPGTETRGAMRFGGRFTRGTVRIDGGVIVGLTERDPSFGFTTGFTWVFRGFTIP
jgi:hypothetical protein